MGNWSIFLNYDKSNTKLQIKTNNQTKHKNSENNPKTSNFQKNKTINQQKNKTEPKSKFSAKPKQQKRKEGNQTKTFIFWKTCKIQKNLGGQTVSPNFGKSWPNDYKKENGTKNQIFRKTQTTKIKMKGTKPKPHFLKKEHAKFKKPGRPNRFSKFRKQLTKCFFLLESPTKSVSQDNWWFKRVLQNVRLPTSMQDLIWFPEVFRIVFRFERSWESRQKPLKNDLTVENYSRKEKRCAWRIRGTFSFLRLSFSRLDVWKLLYFRLKLKFQSLNLNWQK